ncbi:EscU/YscU/HrcU family type III secretion system export apparatus switch protein [Oxalobacter vibrioformis]|uniref:EscU/YscU/HrcU family type III secretion system export apparatus switch protein n=1 Tax=Oxalobacter vibrioformis TaxID=933080 RepID=A0A9E9P265_9BURK|nr:EscU/YscU/HrcU family type III secretion system export apparatus switch protein [Oxalobacter vibrioformis]WAW09554.1 EscU/YscU/HrcU family type III secretion system export apparatus switch protein [Oxalobacter vibrioformis]
MKQPDTQQNAVALAYEVGSRAPKVVAKGRGLIAEEIIRRANESGVFVHQSKELVALLMQVELDQDIPPLLYRVVAELMAWLYHVEARQAARRSPPPPKLDIPKVESIREEK